MAAHCPASQSPTPLPLAAAAGTRGQHARPPRRGPAALRRRGQGAGRGRDGVGMEKLQAFVPQVRGSAFDLEPPALREVQEFGLLVFGSFASPCTHNLPPGLLSPGTQPPPHPSGSCWCPAWHFLSGARFSESVPPAPLVTAVSSCRRAGGMGAKRPSICNVGWDSESQSDFSTLQMRDVGWLFTLFKPPLKYGHTF